MKRTILITVVIIAASTLTRAQEIGDPHTAGAWSKYEPPVMGGYYESSSQPNWNSQHSGNYVDTSRRSCTTYSSGQGYTSFQCN